MSIAEFGSPFALDVKSIADQNQKNITFWYDAFTDVQKIYPNKI